MDKETKKQVLEAMEQLGMECLPSRDDLEGIGRPGVSTRIERNGGYRKTAKDLGLKTKSEFYGRRSTKWTDKEIEKEIMKTEHAKNGYMPSSKDLIEIYAMGRLSSAISKREGFWYWAKKLGLKVKESDSKTGIEKEYEIAEKLKEMYPELNIEITSSGFPYDMLLNYSVKIDVKYSKGGVYGGHFFYAFNLEQNKPKSDLLILICGNEKTLIIPSHHLTGQNQVSISKTSSKDVYIDRWYLLDEYLGFYKGIDNRFNL